METKIFTLYSLLHFPDLYLTQIVLQLHSLVLNRSEFESCLYSVRRQYIP